MADVPAVTNNDDNWKRAVELLTGYILPERSTLFDTLKGNDGIPLMHVRLHKVGGSKYLPGWVSSGGWGRSNSDFVLPYYRDQDGGAEDPAPGNEYLSHYKAFITLIGRKAGSAPPSGDDVVAGGRGRAARSRTRACGTRRAGRSPGMPCL